MLAQVRAVAEAGCAGQAPLAFWAALGFAERFRFAREGSRYALAHDGHALQARRTLCADNLGFENVADLRGRRAARPAAHALALAARRGRA